MTIASEIEDLATNLEAAKSAVTTAGGTVGDTGLAGLADEIATIPTGGGGEIPAYGRVVYYHDVRTVYSASGMMCTATITNMTTFTEFCEEAFSEHGGQGQIQYQDGNWFYDDWSAPDPRVIIPDITAIGLSVVFDEPDPSFAEITCSPSYEVHKESGTSSVDINTSSDLQALCSTDGGWYTVGQTKFYNLAVKSYIFGSSVTTIPQSFLSGTYPETIDYSLATGVTAIQDSVLLGASTPAKFPALLTIGNYVTLYSTDITMPELTTIGNNFTANNASQIILPKVTSIGNRFSASWAGNLGFESLQTVGTNFTATRARWVYMPKIVSIGNVFLNNLIPAEVYMTIGRAPNNSLTSIGTQFLRNGKFTALKDASSSPGSTTNNEFVLPSSVNSIGSLFLAECSNFYSSIYVACPASVVESGGEVTSISIQQTSSTINPAKPLFDTGFSFSGTEASSWRTRFPSITGASYNGRYYYRKLKV